MSNDEEQEGQSGHRAIIQDSWQRAREYIRRAEAADVDPSRAVWPASQESVERQHALAAHTAVIQFRDDILAFRNERTKNDISELWAADYHEFTLEETTYTLSLRGLNEWTNQHLVEHNEVADPVMGQTVETTKFRVLLPVSACRETYRHMQKCLHELGFTADTRDITPEDEASPEHLWGLLDERSQEEAKKNLPERFTPGSAD